jgi:hypothetical protein
MVSKLLRRVLTVTLGCALAAFAVGGISGCSNADEQAIRAGISRDLDAFKNPTQASLSSVIDNDSASIREMRDMGIDPYDFLAHCFRGFDYEIRDVKVSDKTATVTLHVKNKDFSKAIEYANKQAQDSSNLATIQEISTTGDQNGVIKKYAEWLYAGIDSTSEMVEKDLTLKLTKADDGTWNVDDESVKALVEQMYGGVSVGQ